MSETTTVRNDLLADAFAFVSPMTMSPRAYGHGFVIDLMSAAGAIVWPNYAYGPDALLAALAAEQRFFAEDQGRGALDGETYLERARERLRKAMATR